MEGNSVFSPLEKSTEMPDPVPRFGSSKRVKTHHAHPRPKRHCPRGLVINRIQQSTESRIRVDPGFPGCNYRVVRVIAPVGSTARLKLGDSTGTVSCKLLMEACHVDAVKGESGEMLERIRKETGCEVEIQTNRLLICADSDDAMVEIEGNVLAVKRALVSVSSRLQARQIYKTWMVGNKSLGRAFEDRHFNNNIQEALLRPVDIDSHGNLPRSSDGISHIARHKQIEAFLGVLCRGILRRLSQQWKMIIKQWSLSYSVWSKLLVVFIESLTDIKNLESVRGASIDVGDTLPDCDECLITFTSSEIPKDRMPPAQAAIGRVFSRLCEIHTKVSGSWSYITARLVVPTNQMGCLLVSETLRTIGACILVLQVVHNPKCISANDQVVQISGDITIVKLAMYHVTSTLVGNFLLNSRKNSGTKNMTKEIRVPESAVHFVFGEERGRQRLEDLRQISCATVIAHEPQLGTSDRIIAISGTPHEIQIAQKLVQAFIQIGESTSLIGGLCS
ncbi:unnamed protein product [Arabis nemorensis]|uniref:K Homology domain-containing protein n=1 Tax=Arabis nemorensis TaxID=586526 RepID=A0A565CJN8_9BRAS|nr:unnamed protein product [Arabis nemorensis]